MIALLGICHKSAPVSVRELYAFDEQEKQNLTEKIRSKLLLEGIIILSTCNRTEIYFNTQLVNEVVVKQLIMSEVNGFKGVTADYSTHFYFFTDGLAVEQLFRVASGLESMVIGEEQIMAQIKEAFGQAQKYRMSDCIISRLFTKALEAGKQTRTETQINKGAASVSYAAVELCSDIFPDLEERTIMVIGAGQTGDLILQCMLKKNQRDFYIANRTLSKAQDLADLYHGHAIELSEIEQYLPQCDLVITATASKEHLVTKQMVEKARQLREDGPQVFVDLSVPSNIEEKVKELKDTYYYGVDDLKEVVLKNVERRKSSIDHSMEIIMEVKKEFMEWMDIQNLTPTIIAIKKNLKNKHESELEGFKRYKKIKEHELIEQYSEYISEKYTQMFIKKLKLVTTNGKKTEYIKVINELFEEIEND